MNEKELKDMRVAMEINNKISRQTLKDRIYLGLV